MHCYAVACCIGSMRKTTHKEQRFSPAHCGWGRALCKGCLQGFPYITPCQISADATSERCHSQKRLCVVSHHQEPGGLIKKLPSLSNHVSACTGVSTCRPLMAKRYLYEWFFCLPGVESQLGSVQAGDAPLQLSSPVPNFMLPELPQGTPAQTPVTSAASVQHQAAQLPQGTPAQTASTGATSAPSQTPQGSDSMHGLHVGSE